MYLILRLFTLVYSCYFVSHSLTVCPIVCSGASIVEDVVNIELFEDEEKLMKTYERFTKLRELWDSLTNLSKYHESELAMEDEKVCRR